MRFTKGKKAHCLAVDQAFNLHDLKVEQLETVHLIQQTWDPVMFYFSGYL